MSLSERVGRGLFIPAEYNKPKSDLKNKSKKRRREYAKLEYDSSTEGNKHLGKLQIHKCAACGNEIILMKPLKTSKCKDCENILTKSVNRRMRESYANEFKRY